MSFAGEVTQSSQTKQEKENKLSPTPRKDGESITDYAERVAEEHQAQRTRKEEEAKVDTNPTEAEKPTEENAAPANTQTEETNNSRGDSQSKEQPTEVPTGVRSSNENGTLPQSTPTEVDKEPLSEEAAQSLITSMEENAIEDPEIRLTPQTWLETFGINNSIDTPIGKVRMGENQYAKLQDKKRTSEFGMISLTLSDPDVIFVEPSKAKGEDVAERNYSYVFAKTFKRNGNKVKYYTSITVSIDGLEISVSSHFVNPNKMLNKLMGFNREYTKETLFSNSSEMRLAEHQSDVPDLLPTQENNVSSASKDTQSSQTKETKEDKFSPTPRKDGESIIDYAERVAEEHQAQRTRKEEEAKVDTNPTEAQKPTEENTAPANTQTEETNNGRGDSQSKEQPTEVPTGVRSSNENGTLPQSTPTEVGEPQPIGNSFFGKVYNQFKGKAKEAVNFLMRHKSGKLLGVFHRNDIGEISLVWGDEKGGLAHIISKHIVEQNDFNNIDEVINTMQQVINNGTITRENKDKVVIDYNDYRVAIRKQTRDNNGNVVEQGNWVVTAFDKSRSKKDKTPSEKTLSTPPFNQETDGVTLPSNGVPTSKDTQSSQTKETKEDKFSPTPRKDGESITDYAERVAEEHQTQRTRKEEEAKVDTNPTEAQKEAGNYKKGHIKVDGLDITIEQPKGSIRRGTDANGKQWKSEIHNTYGYIRGTESVDGDHIDIFLSDNPTEGKVFVVDQVNKDGSFDEHKVMYGFPDMESAKRAYLSNYEEGWQGLGSITEVKKEDFKKWIDSSKRKTKPFAKYSTVKTQGDVQTKKPTEENAAPANTETNENYAHNSEKIMHEQKNVQLQQAINAYENATKFYYQQLKEGKLDKVFESKQWKDVLRKQTELQKALLQLNSEELKELLKQTTNEDTKKEIKGALDAVLRQEQRSIEYNAVLDKQEPITPIYKEEKKPIAVTEFVETDKKEAEIHPVLTGVYHDNGYVVGTNAHILLARKEDYNKSLEGKITNKKGEVIDGKYPNWRAVVEGETTTNSWGINLDELHAFVRGVLAKLKADGAKKSSIDSATIAFKDTDGKIIVCNAKTLDKALRGAKSIGATEFGNTPEIFAHAQTKKGYVVCPTISTYHSINDNCFVYAPKEAARQQTTATLTNDTEAKQKATEAVLAALSKAGIEVVQATDEQAQAMLANEIGAEKQVVYHGSRAKFKNFDHSHMGEGEGQQAYGWGSYVTEVESIGRTYAAGNGKIKFRGFVLEAMHSLEVKEHFSGAERKVLNFLHKWIKRSNNASTAIEKVKEWASNEYEKYSGRRNWSDQDYKDYFGAISKRDVREWRKEMEEKEENAQQMLSFIETLSVDDFSFSQRHLYTVDIPDDTGSNYLNWEQPMSDEQLDAIEEYLKENYRASRVKIFTDGIAKSNSSNAQEVDAFTRQGKNIYHLLEHTIGDDKSVSEMLGSLGYTGISYPAQYQSGGRADNARNYVIFNEKDLKITDHIQFMRTPTRHNLWLVG